MQSLRLFALAVVILYCCSATVTGAQNDKPVESVPACPVYTKSCSAFSDALQEFVFPGHLYRLDEYYHSGPPKSLFTVGTNGLSKKCCYMLIVGFRRLAWIPDFNDAVSNQSTEFGLAQKIFGDFAKEYTLSNESSKVASDGSWVGFWKYEFGTENRTSYKTGNYCPYKAEPAKLSRSQGLTSLLKESNENLPFYCEAILYKYKPTQLPPSTVKSNWVDHTGYTGKPAGSSVHEHTDKNSSSPETTRQGRSVDIHGDDGNKGDTAAYIAAPIGALLLLALIVAAVIVFNKNRKGKGSEETEAGDARAGSTTASAAPPGGEPGSSQPLTSQQDKGTSANNQDDSQQGP